MLKGKRVLVTGAGSGLGRAISIACADAGAELAVLDRNGEAAEDTLDQIATRGVAVRADVTDGNQIAEALERTERELGPIDVLVNNAGVGAVAKKVHELTDDEWAQVLAVNLTGPFAMCRAVLPSMIARASGVIVTIGSVAGMIAFPGRSPYAVSKAGVIHLTRSIAAEYAELGIRANALCPGWMDTPLTHDRLQDAAVFERLTATVPMGRVAPPEELAGAAVFLASDASSYMTGQTLVVDGGWSAV